MLSNARFTDGVMEAISKGVRDALEQSIAKGNHVYPTVTAATLRTALPLSLAPDARLSDIRDAISKHRRRGGNTLVYYVSTYRARCPRNGDGVIVSVEALGSEPLIVFATVREGVVGEWMPVDASSALVSAADGGALN